MTPTPPARGLFLCFHNKKDLKKPEKNLCRPAAAPSYGVIVTRGAQAPHEAQARKGKRDGRSHAAPPPPPRAAEGKPEGMQERDSTTKRRENHGRNHDGTRTAQGRNAHPPTGKARGRIHRTAALTRLDKELCHAHLEGFGAVGRYHLPLLAVKPNDGLLETGVCGD